MLNICRALISGLFLTGFGGKLPSIHKGYFLCILGVVLVSRPSFAGAGYREEYLPIRPDAVSIMMCFFTWLFIFA